MSDEAGNAGWEERVAALWERIDAYGPEEFRERIAELAGERGDEDAAAVFERGAAHDSTGLPVEAVRYYRRALDLGLTGLRRRRAVIQLASSLRNPGRDREAASLALGALAPLLPRYNRSLAHYARALLTAPDGS